jgi:putative superfamily III holin-X
MQPTSQRGPGVDPALSSATDPGLSLSAALRSVYLEVSALLHDHLRLAALEAQRALRNVAMMIALGVVAALLAVTAWLALVAGLVALAVELGASWPAGFLVASIVSLAVALAAGVWIKHLSAQLMFALTLRWLRPPAAQTAPAREAHT